tara:strand:- start:373 stop:546 length:174 start_codon:yes stop_codon:yes gene_type:complete
MVLNTETTPRVAWCRKGDKVFVTQPRVAERKRKKCVSEKVCKQGRNKSGLPFLDFGI